MIVSLNLTSLLGSVHTVHMIDYCSIIMHVKVNSDCYNYLDVCREGHSEQGRVLNYEHSTLLLFFGRGLQLQDYQYHVCSFQSI